MDASPVKRRVLGALDANACSPKVRREVKLAGLSPVKMRAAAPMQAVAAAVSPTCVLSTTPNSLKREAESRKRLSPSSTSTPAPGMTARDDEADDGEPAAKRPCIDSRPQQAAPRAESPPSSISTTRATTARHRSASPYTPSVFDTSAVDNSQVTILTEPDTSGPAPAPAPRLRPRLTREQAREKAEILRLRLGLASYKVRTGQTDVPLSRLEAQLLRPSSRNLPRAASFSQQQQQQQHNNPPSSAQGASGPTSVSASLPPAGATASSLGTGRALLPGASLRRGSSSASVSFAEQAQEQERDRGREQGQDGEIEGAAAAAAPPPLRRALEEEWRSHPRPRPHSQQHHHHQRRQSEALLATSSGRGGAAHQQQQQQRRRYSSEAGVPPRPRTATEVPLPGMFRGRGGGSLVVGGEGLEEVDGEEDRGGAASGLLSLARS